MNVLTYSHQLTSLNLSNNRIHKLDDLTELVTKVPHLKTLNLSNNEVKCLNLFLFTLSKELHFKVTHNLFSLGECNASLTDVWLPH